ncbi:ParB/RepB/Spo0J family partition protein [Yinghuangia aomiensis]
MAGQRTSLASLAGKKVEDVPGRGAVTLLTLPLAAVVPTPLNPRTNFGSDTELAELGASTRRRQLQPIVVVTRALYLKHFPEHDRIVGSDETSYVIAVGERRFRAASAAGHATIEAAIRDEVIATRQDFVDAVLSENLDRKNFDPIEEAVAIDLLVQEFGSARAAAAHREKTESWVSQRRSLLRLADPIREMVRAKEISVEAARSLAKAVKDHKLDPQQQLDWWKARQLAAASTRDTPLPPEPDPDTPPGADEDTGPRTLPGSPVTSQKAGKAPASRKPRGLPAKPEPKQGHVPHQAASQRGTAEPERPRVFSVSGQNPKELAVALAAELSGEDLITLIEELHAHV